MVGYSAAGAETQQPYSLRNLKGLIVLDVGVKLAKEADRAFYCNALATDQATLNSGVYSDDSAPTDPSDMIPGMTNYQAALFLGTSTEFVNGQFWHFVGGDLDENGIPSDLRYSQAQLWLDLLQNMPPHYPEREDVEADSLFCGQTDSPVTEYLGQIGVPILHVAAAGGFANNGPYTATFTKSKDVKTVMVQRLADDQRQQDFGHADTVLANDADTAVWKPILDWIVAHP
jgi:hypothetical protein